MEAGSPGSSERVKSPHPQPCHRRHLPARPHKAGLVPGRPPSPRHRFKEKPLSTWAEVPTGKTMSVTLIPKADFRQLWPFPWALGLGVAGAGHRDARVPEAGHPAPSQLPSGEMQALFLTLAIPQKSGMVPSEASLGRLSSEGRVRRRTRRDPVVPAEAGLRCALGSRLHFHLLPLYRRQHRKLGAKTGAAPLNDNKKPCQGRGSPGTSHNSGTTWYPAPSPNQPPGSAGLEVHGQTSLWVPRPRAGRGQAWGSYF